MPADFLKKGFKGKGLVYKTDAVVSLRASVLFDASKDCKPLVFKPRLKISSICFSSSTIKNFIGGNTPCGFYISMIFGLSHIPTDHYYYQEICTAWPVPRQGFYRLWTSPLDLKFQGGRHLSVMTPALLFTMANHITFWSSLTLPGHRCFSSSSQDLSENVKFLLYWMQASLIKYSPSWRMSSRRSRKGGNSREKPILL